MTTLYVKIKPSAKEDKVIKGENGEITIYTKARPQEGQANKAIVEILSKDLGVAKSLITIDKKSLKSKIKKITIDSNL